jgi:hypothetical protein
VFPPPTGRSPSREQVRTLDDSFFSSNPYNYFLARIDSLISYADGASANLETGVGAAFARHLGWVRNKEIIETTESARELQVAVDAMSLRQHAGEAVARLWLALLQTRHEALGSVSIWATLTRTPTKNSAALNAIMECNGWDDPRVHQTLLLPEPYFTRFETDALVRQGADVLHKWLEHIPMLLTRNDIHIAAANNKYKHGLAIRPRNDERISIFRAISSESDAPISAAEEVVIFDKPFVEYLAEGPSDESGKHGLELTRLRLDTPVLLVEANMLATLYGALFHVAAAKYATWSDSVGEIASYPPLPLGPTPEQLLSKSITGMRSPVTFRPDGSPATRGHAIGFNSGEWVTMDVNYSSHRKARFVADMEDV